MRAPLFIKRLLFGGSSHLSKTEVSLLDAVRRALSSEESEIIEQQVLDVETVQVTGAGRIVTLWYRSNPSSPILGTDDFCLARFEIEENRRKSSGSLWVHRGRLQ